MFIFASDFTFSVLGENHMYTKKFFYFNIHQQTALKPHKFAKSYTSYVILAIGPILLDRVSRNTLHYFFFYRIDVKIIPQTLFLAV